MLTNPAMEDRAYHAAVVDLLGAIAYGEISAFERLADTAVRQGRRGMCVRVTVLVARDQNFGDVRRRQPSKPQALAARPDCRQQRVRGIGDQDEGRGVGRLFESLVTLSTILLVSMQTCSRTRYLLNFLLTVAFGTKLISCQVQSIV